MRKFWLWAALGWTLAMLVACLAQFSDLPKVPVADADKGVHVLMHAGFTFLWLQAIRESASAAAKWQLILKVVASSLVFGILIELAQHWFTTTRSADVKDVVANFSGAVLAAAVWYAVDKSR